MNNIKDTAIVMTLCNRPAYTETVLNALSRCDGIDGMPVYFMCEPINQQVITLAKLFPKPCEVLTYPEQVGCNLNTAYALAKGFSVAKRVIALEDDTVPGRDFLRFMDWALTKYQDDKNVCTVSGYQRTSPNELDRTSEVIRENWFTPWGWGTWLDRYESFAMGWPAKDDQISWDAVLHRAKLQGRCEIRPVVARIQNIGAEGGLHVPSADWHANHHLNRDWIECTRSDVVSEYVEVEPTESQLRVNFPC